MIPLVYVGGSMTAESSIGWAENCFAWVRPVHDILKAGAACHAPGIQGIFYQKDFTHEEIMPLDLKVLSRCDLLFVLPGWQHSRGTRDEVDFATRHGIPWTDDWDTLLQWIEEYKDAGKEI